MAFSPGVPVGTFSGRHVRPFFVAMMVDPRAVLPTAQHFVAETHDTAHSSTVPLGTGWAVQLEPPFDVARMKPAKPDDAPVYPTATQLEVEEHDSPSRL